MITEEKWNFAQVKERAWHDRHPLTEDKARVYMTSYFEYLNIPFDCAGRTVIEIGPADNPALYYCTNVKGIIIDPLPSAKLKAKCEEKGFTLITERAEDAVFPEANEIWLFNVLQHTMDPALIIEKAKNTGCVKFFEPIDFGTDQMHLHNFTLDYFRQYFDDVRLYPRHEGLETFHKHQCAYGVNKRV